MNEKGECLRRRRRREELGEGKTTNFTVVFTALHAM